MSAEFRKQGPTRCKYWGRGGGGTNFTRLFLNRTVGQHFLICNTPDSNSLVAKKPGRARRFHGKSRPCPNFRPYRICPSCQSKMEKTGFSLGNGIPLRNSCHVTLSLSHNKLILRRGGSTKTRRDLPAGFANRPQIIGATLDITRREECQIKRPGRSGCSGRGTTGWTLRRADGPEYRYGSSGADQINLLYK